MIFSAVPKLSNRKEAQLIVIPFWEQQRKAKPAVALGILESNLKSPLELGDFRGKEGEVLFVYAPQFHEKRVLLLGLGKEEVFTQESLRKSCAQVVKECRRKKITDINFVVPHLAELRKMSSEECVKAIAEGILLTNYRWGHQKNLVSAEERGLLKSVSLIGILPKMLDLLQTCELTAEGVYFARDLINGNAEIVTPKYLAQSALKIAEKFSSVKATILDRKAIEKEKMGLFLAVAQGSSLEPAFIILSHKGDPRSKDHTVIIGKGVTFDTGGLNLKPTGSMETMRDDMSGAAAALASIAVAASLKLKRNVTAVVAATDNAIGSRSFRPGDVYKSRAGLSVEIANTDAEGRLTLADALSYAEDELKPTRMIDLATLTGSMVIALGEGISGLWSNDETLAKQLLEASSRTTEPLWRMPLYAPYKEQIKSDIADLKNSGGRQAGCVTAALFLQEFVAKTPWAHIDIAGTAFQSKENGYWPKNATGFGVRLLIDFLQNLPNS